MVDVVGVVMLSMWPRCPRYIALMTLFHSQSIAFSARKSIETVAKKPTNAVFFKFDKNVCYFYGFFTLALFFSVIIQILLVLFLFNLIFSISLL